MDDGLIKNIFIYVGIPTIIGALIYIGRKLQILDDLKDSSLKIKHNVKVICDALIKSESVDFDHENLQAYSPLRLTEKGEELVKKIGFEDIFKEHQTDFFDFIKSESPKGDYDIELASIKSIFYLFDKPYFAPVKEYLFTNPKSDQKKLFTVLGVYVRDKYLKK
jgi:hypothetical protein